MISRRSLLGRALAYALLSLGGGLVPNGRVYGAPESAPRETLAAFLDTLIPADATPAATEIGVTDDLLKLSGQHPRLGKLIEKGCDWLDREARALGASGFARLAEDRREVIAQKAADGAGGLVASIFFDRVKADAFARYYADPRIWADLDYPGPPQPAGFMSYREPPDA